MAFLGGAVVKNALPANTGHAGLFPGSGRSPGVGQGNHLQYYCMENSRDKRSLVGYSPWSPKESDAAEHTGTQLCNHKHNHNSSITQKIILYPFVVNFYKSQVWFLPVQSAYSKTLHKLKHNAESFESLFLQGNAFKSH